MEQVGLLQVGGEDVTIVGSDVIVGQSAPEFSLQDQSWQTINILEESKGKVRILTALPSLHTGVCDRETRRFNQEAAELDENIEIIAISTDLPFSQKDWCGAAGVDRVKVLSDHMDTDFGKKYGCLIKERRILRRAVFVIDAEGKIVYADYMKTLGDEPNYEAVLNAAQSVLA